MTLAEFFASDAVVLPRGGFTEGKQTFDEFLSDVVRDYVAHIQMVDDPAFPVICAKAKDSPPEVEFALG
jgi:hypothetical protein